MKSSVLHIIRSGTLSLIQDKGRIGIAHLGIPPGGYFDDRSAHIANWLVNNSLNDALIEIAGVGFKARFEGTGCFALSGAMGEWTLNGKAVEQFRSNSFSTNDILHLHQLNNGYRSYLSIGGKINNSPWLKSYGCFLFGSQPFPASSLLRPGSSIEFSQGKNSSGKYFPSDGISSFSNLKFVRILGGPEFDWFTTDQVNHFLEESYTLSNLSSRMGLRLEGSPIDTSNFKQMISSGILPGTIQINAEGLPMILGIDAQTMGGYPRLGVVAQADISRVAQLAPGHVIRFRLIDQDDARQLSHYQKKRLEHFFALAN